MRVLPIAPNMRVPGRPPRATGRFAVPDGDADPESSVVTPMLPALLSGLQEAPGELSEADRRCMGQGIAVLDALHRFQAGLLNGTPDCAEILAAVDQLAEGANPQIAKLMAAIRVRAMVVAAQQICRPRESA